MATLIKKPAHEVILGHLKEELEILSRYEQMESLAYQPQNRMEIERKIGFLIKILREMVVPDGVRDAVVKRLKEMRSIDKGRDWESFDAKKEIDEAIRDILEAV
jgi:hypothetical protein